MDFLFEGDAGDGLAGGEDHAVWSARGGDGGEAGDGDGEAVAAAGNGFDQAAAGAVAGKGFAEKEDVLGEVALLDEGFGPEVAEEFVLGDDAIGVVDEEEEEVEGLAIEREGLIAPG